MNGREVYHSKGLSSEDSESISADELEQQESGEGEDPLHEEPEPLEESIYGWAVSMVVRDVVWLDRGSRVPYHRCARIVNSIILIVATITLQIFLILAVSRLLSAPAVHHIRERYGSYESKMYGNHTHLTVNGFPRGIPGFRVDDNFQKMLSEDDQKEICKVPLAHPWYLISILFIWTLTCQVELRAIFETGVRLLWRTPMVASEGQVIRERDEHEAEVVGLTCMMKAVIGIFILFPRTLTILALNYIGCRWLTATLGLGDVLLNGLALEFLVVLKELLYNVCVSNRNRVDTQRLLVKPLRDVNTASFCTFFDAQVWGLISIGWSYMYVYHIQMVLPDYRWDLRDLCTKNLPKGPLF